MFEVRTKSSAARRHFAKRNPLGARTSRTANLSKTVASALAAICATGTTIASQPPRAQAAQKSAIVQTSAGPVQGLKISGTSRFLGIPYAAPPLGDLRWRPPAEHAPWSEVLQATHYAPICALTTTLGVFSGPRNDNEDCLHLNVFSPDVRQSASLPVIVYIHGGGNYNGETPGLDGNKLAAQGGVIVVTVEYRLNLMGFLAHPALDREGHLFGNYGILDQQAALKWVQRNIANFGGDPTKVTLAGQSAGATDTMINLVSPLSVGLFHRAICQSACVSNYPLVPKSKAEGIGITFAKAAGCGSGVGPDVAMCLRNLPAAKIEELAGSASSKSQFIIGPGIIDGQIVPDEPLALFRRGSFHRMPIMNGVTRDEAKFFLAVTQYWSHSNNTSRTPPTAGQYLNYINSTFLPPQYPSGTASKVLETYPLGDRTSPQAVWTRVASDMTFSCSARDFNRLLASEVPVFAYEFVESSAPSYLPKLPGLEMGAYHTADIQYLFPFWHGGPDGVRKPLNRQQRKLSDRIVSAWANFARYGNPNGTGNGPWARFPTTSDLPGWAIQDVRGLPSLTDAQYSAFHHCDLWDSIH